MRLLTCAAKVFFHNATDLQYQLLLINMISHVATAVDHKVATYHKVATWHGIVNYGNGNKRM